MSIRAIILLIIIVQSALFGQTEKPDSYLEIIGVTEYMMQPLPGAKVELIKNGDIVKTVSSSSSGRFKLILDMNNIYTVKISHPGYISKSIQFNTNVPQGTKGRWVNEFAMGLVEPCEGINYGLLEYPVDKVYYHERKDRFVSDKEYSIDLAGAMDVLLTEVQQCLQERYAAILAEADKLFSEKKYSDARNKYMLATQADPYDRYPPRMIDEIDRLMAQQNIDDQKYNETIILADNAYETEDYNKALRFYEQAIQLKNTEYARDRMSEINAMLQQNKAAEARQEEIEQQYNRLVSQANTAYYSKNYEQARQLYASALQLKPNDTFANDRLNEINNEMAVQQQEQQLQQERKQMYQSAIATADGLYNLQEYEQALTAYYKALSNNPGDKYAKTKVNDIESMLEEQEQKEARQQKMQIQYNTVIQEADKLLAANDLQAAAVAYKKANSLNPTADYPQQKLTEIQKRTAINQAYQQKVTQADNLFTQGQYQQAQAFYEQAKALNPESTHASVRLTEIALEMARLSREQAKREELDRRYDETIKTADAMVLEQQYSNALEEYNRALIYKPGQEYPKTRIAEVEGLLAEQRRLQAELAAKKELYKKAITSADINFNQGDYQAAIAGYTRAQQILPDETYPTEKLDEIASIMAERMRALELKEARNESFKQAISKADKFYDSQQYTEAKTSYQEALSIIEGDRHATERISTINNILAQHEAERIKQMQLKKQYDQAIASADNFYNSNNYQAAKSEYEKALGIIPGEEYPAKRIKQIDDLLALLSKSSTKQNTNTATQPVTKEPQKINKLVFKNPSEKEKYIKSLLSKYPAGITLEVYKDKFTTTNRYIVVRDGEVNEFREIKYSWGTELYHFDIQTTRLFFNQQTKRQGGETFNKINK